MLQAGELGADFLQAMEGNLGDRKIRAIPRIGEHVAPWIDHEGMAVRFALGGVPATLSGSEHVAGVFDGSGARSIIVRFAVTP